MFLSAPFWPPNYLYRAMCRYKLKLTVHCKWSHLYLFYVSLTLHIISERYLTRIVEKWRSPGGATCNMTFNQTDIYESVNIIQCLWNFPYVFQIMKYEGLPSVPVILWNHHWLEVWCNLQATFYFFISLWRVFSVPMSKL